MTLKRYRYRAYPTGGQARMLARTFGSCRVVFNDFIAERNRLYKAGLHRQVPFAETARLVTTVAKTTPERAWLREVSAVPLQQAADDAARAYRNFFSSLAGKRKGRRMGLRSRDLPSAPSSVTVIREADGTYWVSFVVDEPAPAHAPGTGQAAALDLGLTDLAAVVTADPGTGQATRSKVSNPRPLEAAQRRLTRQQRALSRKQKGSANRAKARVKVARTHRKVRDLRSDHHHKLAADLVTANAVICLETLSLAGMGRTRLARSVHDAGLGNVIRLITEKAESQGRIVVRTGRWEPTTQTCSVCGTPGGKKPLSVREWTCQGCGTRLDRDYNAAVNILVAAGLAETLNACGPGVRHRLAGAAGDEAGTRRTEAAA